MRRKLLGEGRRHSRSPLRRRWSNHRNPAFADRRRHDKCNERLVLVIQNSGLDLAELGLQDILHGLSLNAMSAHFELRIDPAEEVHALRLNVDLALVPGTVEAAELEGV